MGGIQSDGQRTLLTTEQCLLNRNRNAHLGKDEMTRRLQDYLGAEQVIWLPRGCKFDGKRDSIQLAAYLAHSRCVQLRKLEIRKRGARSFHKQAN